MDNCVLGEAEVASETGPRDGPRFIGSGGSASAKVAVSRLSAEGSISRPFLFLPRRVRMRTLQ